MKYQIFQAAVIGAGTMGAAIAAHLANAGLSVILLDIVPDSPTPEETRAGFSLSSREVRNRIVRQGYERALQSKPASFFSEAMAARVRIGNLEDDFELVATADWIIEAIVENLATKQVLMERLDQVRKPEAIVSTNTSGIPVASIAAGRSESFRRHFLGTHFFNPPRYLKLLEIIPTSETLGEVVQAIAHFGEYRLGKGIVLCKDTPNFIANRLAFGSAAFALDYILTHHFTVGEVDAITGPAIGNPKTATFRLMDLVGIDVWDHVGRNLAPLIPDDEMAQEYLKSIPANQLMKSMLELGRLGNKSRQGFYKEMRNSEGQKEFWELDLESREYRAPEKVRFESLTKAKKEDELAARLNIFLSAEDRAGDLVRALIYQSLAYASHRIPEIADTPKAIDDAMRWGFGREAGPFEIWDDLGVAETCQSMQAAGFPAAAWVNEMLDGGIGHFYQKENSTEIGVYNHANKGYQPIQPNRSIIFLADLKHTPQVIKSNPGASLIDLGGGVACVEFHTKANSLDDDVFNMLQDGLDVVERDFQGLVVGNDADNFCAGANLFMVVMAAQSGMWDTLESAVRKMQQVNMRMQSFPKPVVMAVTGITIGGGTEIMMHGSRVVSSAELYAGQVEIGVGVIPAGAGTKELLRRILNPAMRIANVDPLPYLQRLFELIGLGKVSVSAEEARQMGFLSPADRIVMNRSHLLAEAKREVIHLAECQYRPAYPEKIYAAGRNALAALKVGSYMMQEGGYITEHEKKIADKLASILTGGELSQPTWVEADYILDLEREAFLSLCGEEKTQQRMWHMLQNNKPLRN